MISYLFNFIRQDISSAYQRFRQEWIDYWNDLPKSYQYRILLASSLVGFLWLLFSAIVIYYLFSLLPWDTVFSFIRDLPSYLPLDAAVSFFRNLHSYLSSDDLYTAVFGIAGFFFSFGLILSAFNLVRR